MIDRPDIQALGAEIQRDLRVSDWQVQYLYVRNLRADQFVAWAEGREPEGGPVYGLCDRLADNKTATILVRDPSDPLPAGAAAKTVDAVLTHEITHLHFAPFAVNTQQGILAEENAVWALADEIARLRAEARGDRADMIARAMDMRGPHYITEEIRKMGANAKALAMLKAAMESDGAKEDSAAAKCLAALMADDEKAPPDGESEEAKKAKAARAAEVEEEGRKAAAARAAAPPAAATAAAMTIADVDARAAAIAGRVYGEHSERAAIIVSMGDKLTTEERTVWGGLPLPTVKQLAAARGTGATAAPGAQRAARAGVGPVGRMPADPLAYVPAADRADTAVAVQRIALAFGLETDRRPAVEITSRGMSLSNVGSVQDQYAELVRAGQIAVQQRGA